MKKVIISLVLMWVSAVSALCLTAVSKYGSISSLYFIVAIVVVVISAFCALYWGIAKEQMGIAKEQMGKN